MKIAIGCDHAGYDLKEHLKQAFSHLEFEDKGTFGPDSVDYPDYAHQVAEAAGSVEDISFGILICGSANGVAMTANKHQNVRAAICWLPEIAALAKQHNNANVICLPARFITNEEAEDIVKAYIDVQFEGGRHQRRVDKIAC
ncbi:MAG: ribose 5-phosphate isomerase B [Bacteroidia bacterium]